MFSRAQKLLCILPEILCGTITALELAKRDVVLGLNAPLWKMLFPAVAGVHCIANLKGKKPILKWNFRLSC
jgi:hypothetical protein